MNKLLIMLTVSALAGCATNDAQIVPQPNGIYQSIATGASKEDVRISTLKAAEDTCNKRNLRHIVTNEATSYKGLVSEDAGRMIEMAVSILSTTGFLPGTKSDKDYEMTLTFYCEA
jgi:hypothetical protein